MHLRLWVSGLALLGMLMHAGAIVRHHTVMLGTALHAQVILADLAQICHGGGDAVALPPADLPQLPVPTDVQHACPLCSGLASAFALPPPQPPLMQTLRAVDAHFVFPASYIPISRHTPCPPARGPPSVA